MITNFVKSEFWGHIFHVSSDKVKLLTFILDSSLIGHNQYCIRRNCRRKISVTNPVSMDLDSIALGAGRQNQSEWDLSLSWPDLR